MMLIQFYLLASAASFVWEQPLYLQACVFCMWLQIYFYYLSMISDFAPLITLYLYQDNERHEKRKQGSTIRIEVPVFLMLHFLKELNRNCPSFASAVI
ncbi:hypothetical protein DFH11DRAFT_1598332 [Phellopilus nigrolimitatus]|nr:hypothetical protein DFH11DRAFT_1598332 [Phellopilus nigrolimitatus]